MVELEFVVWVVIDYKFGMIVIGENVCIFCVVVL